MNEEKLNFKPVTISDKDLVNKYMKPYGENSCQHSFVCLFTLREKYGSKICEKDGFLFIFRENLCTEGKRVYLAPIGNGDLKLAYETLLNDAKSYNCKAVFETITKPQVDFLKANFKGRFDYVQLRDYAEYLYDAETMCKMPGKKFSDKRNRISHLLKNYEGRISSEPFDKEKLSDVWEFQKKWFKESAENHDVKALEMEMNSIRIQLDHFDELELEGRIIYIDKEIVAFFYGTALNENCFDGLIAKANRNIKNLSKLLYWETSMHCAMKYTYFNLEEDVGVEGLRKMKMLYYPMALIKKYLVTEREDLSTEAESEIIPVQASVPLNPNEESIPDLWEIKVKE